MTGTGRALAREASTSTRPTTTAKRQKKSGDGPAKKSVPAVTRAVAVLKFLAQSDEPMGVNAIARAVDIIPSTCLHILRALVDEELVAFDPMTKHYTLDVGIAALARSALSRNRFAQIAQPLVDRISQQYNVTAIGVQTIGLEHMVVVAISQAANLLNLHVDLGSRFPALISATGRCVAAFTHAPWSEIARRFKSLRWHKAPSLAEWRQQLEATRQMRYAVDDGNYLAGVTIIAAPVFNPAKHLQHALVVVGIGEQLHRVGVENVARELRRAAEELTVQLGGSIPDTSLSDFGAEE